MTRGGEINEAITCGLAPTTPLRNSAIPWIGHVPAHWEILRLKWAVMLQRGHDLPADERVDGNIPIVSSSGISGFHNAAVAKAPGIVTGRYGTIGVFHLIEEDYWPLNTTLYSIDLNGNDPTFLRALLESIAPLFVLNSKKSAVPGVDRNDVLSIPVALPKRGEQELIAAFLDWKTGQIDALIARKKELIEKLKEKRLAVITQAVTRGLNPAAPLRDSGIPWLGHVPAHWELCHLKRKFRSVEYGISEALEPEGEVAILRMGNIENGKVALDDLKFIDSVPDGLLLQRGDLLYNRTNSLELIGKVGMFTGGSEKPVSFASYLVRIRVEEGCLPEYFAYMLNTEGILGVARSHAFIAIGQCNLNPTRYGQIKAAIPPQDEQQAIVCFLDEKTEPIDTLVHKAQSAVARLTEYRTALITAATTGKIDVRGVKIPSQAA